MKTYAVYLKPKSSITSEIGSDTLFGAFCWAIRALHSTARLKSILDAFNEHPEHPKFVLSSAFPFLYRDGKKVRFYPKPMLAELSSEQVERLASESESTKRTYYGELAHKIAVIETVTKAKTMKSVSYVSESLFTEIVQGETDTEAIIRRLVQRGAKDEDIECVGNVFITKGERANIDIDTDAERKSFRKETDVQRNAIDRVAGSTIEGRLFFTKEIVFSQGVAGLWFALRTNDIDFIKPLLRYLADTGIGGNRTVGKGHFVIPLDELEELALPQADNEVNCFISLSRYFPVDGECNFEKQSSYVLSILRPKHESMLTGSGHRIYKKMLKLFEPGSILLFTVKKEFYGKIISVGSNAEQGGWEVWHNGMTIPAFANIGDEG